MSKPDVAIRLQGVSKDFGTGRPALYSTDLEIYEGEFFSLLGPSGCGKTTTLRLIGGFESASTGVVSLQGTDVTHIPPDKRDVNMVFQSYALFPHLTIEKNVAFGLRFKKLSKAEKSARVKEALELVQLQDFARRRPNELSGGQQQRVALARALINRPKALLLDEPLAALDLKLRQSMQYELKRIQREVGITFVFVTHDQGEALSLSDRIAVMNNGSIEQVGTPFDLYNKPASRFVADFIGTANILKAHFIAQSADQAIARLGDTEHVTATGIQEDGEYDFSIRPENIRLTLQPAGQEDSAMLQCRVIDIDYTGMTTAIRCEHDQLGPILVMQSSRQFYAESIGLGDIVTLSWDIADVRVFSSEQE